MHPGREKRILPRHVRSMGHLYHGPPPTRHRQPVERVDHVVRGERPACLGRQRLACGLVDHGQHEGPAADLRSSVARRFSCQGKSIHSSARCFFFMRTPRCLVAEVSKTTRSRSGSGVSGKSRSATTSAAGLSDNGWVNDASFTQLLSNGTDCPRRARA